MHLRDLTTQSLAEFLNGGQVMIHDVTTRQTQQGAPATIVVDKDILTVRFEWLARREGSGAESCWVPADQLDYTLPLTEEHTTVTKGAHGIGMITLRNVATADLLVFMPAGSNALLDATQIQARETADVA